MAPCHGAVGGSNPLGHSNIWLYRIEVITSGCLPENQGSIPCKVASDESAIVLCIGSTFSLGANPSPAAIAG